MARTLIDKTFSAVTHLAAEAFADLWILDYSA